MGGRPVLSRTERVSSICTRFSPASAALRATAAFSTARASLALSDVETKARALDGVCRDGQLFDVFSAQSAVGLCRVAPVRMAIGDCGHQERLLPKVIVNGDVPVGNLPVTGNRNEQKYLAHSRWLQAGLRDDPRMYPVSPTANRETAGQPALRDRARAGCIHPVPGKSTARPRPYRRRRDSV